MRAFFGAAVAVVAVVASAATRRVDAPVEVSTDASFRTAVRGFVAALPQDHRSRACFAFDDPLRLDWHFVPRERKGLPLGDMSDEERRATHALLRTFLTPRGYGRALGVIELESVLRELENNPGRDPGRYFVSVFGDPSGEKPWSLRFEGHHLTLNFTGEGADGLAPTPLFFGANPGEVRSGSRAGFKLLAPHEELARALMKSLDVTQRAKALIAETAYPEVLFGPGKSIDASARAGLAVAELTAAQQRLFGDLVAEVTGDVASRSAGAFAADARFAWAGGLEPGQGHYWRLTSGADVFEYDNTQNDANHVHFLWRDAKNDFAADWLARHHAAER
jgi:hypothetical protein